MRYTFFAAVIIAFFFIGPLPARAEDKDPLATLRKGHPRLLFLDDDVARVKEQIKSDPFAEAWFEKLSKSAEGQLTQPLAERVLVGPRLLQVSRNVLNRVSLLAGLYRITGDHRYFVRARDEMLNVAKFEDWHPPHFLDVAEMTNAMAIGYDWLYADLSPADRETIKTAIIEKGLKPGLKYQASNKDTHTQTNNWNQVCNGGLTVGALAIADEDPAIARQIIETARELVPKAMANFAPDGGWEEGPGYWSYATQYNAFYIAALQTALGTDQDLLQMPGFADAGMFRIQSIGPLGQTFNFADAHPSVGSASQMFWLAKVFNRPVYAAHERLLGNDHNKIDPFHLYWFNPAGDEKEIAALPTATVFKRINVAFLRSSWTDANAAYVGFKGGDNAASHGHADLGTFVYDADGVRWALDLGADDYNLPDYFGKKRYTYYRLRTEGHNTLTLGTENQNLKDAIAPIVAFSDKPNESFVVTDLTAGYTPTASRVQRGIQLLNRQLLIQDEFESTEPAEVVWNVHTDCKPTIDPDGTMATLKHDKKELIAKILEPAGAKFEIISANPPPPQAQQPKAVNLIIRQPEKTKSLRLVVLLTPKSDQPAEVKIQPLLKWIDAAPGKRSDHSHKSSNCHAEVLLPIITVEKPDATSTFSKIMRGLRLLSIFLLTTPILAQRKPALPMAEYQTPYYVIHTDLTGDDLKEAALRMTKMAEEYHARTSAFAGSITQKLPFYLFTREQDYYNAGGPEGSAGVFDPNTLTLMAVADLRADQHTWNTVQHEGFHQFAHAVIGGELPIWVNEGLAEYFGEGVFTGDSFVTGVIRPERLARLKQEFAETDKYKVLLKAATNEKDKAAIDKGSAFRPVKEMMLLAHKDWNEELSIVNYDQAWSMVQFLAHGDNGKYQAAFVSFMRAIGRGQQWDKAWLTSFGSAEGFEQRWQAYWNALPEDPTLALIRQSRHRNSHQPASPSHSPKAKVRHVRRVLSCRSIADSQN